MKLPNADKAIIAPENSEILAQHILKLYEDGELREEMGRKGRGYAERELALTVAAKRYETLLARTVAQSSTL